METLERPVEARALGDACPVLAPDLIDTTRARRPISAPTIRSQFDPRSVWEGAGDTLPKMGDDDPICSRHRRLLRASELGDYCPECDAEKVVELAERRPPFLCCECAREAGYQPSGTWRCPFHDEKEAA